MASFRQVQRHLVPMAAELGMSVSELLIIMHGTNPGSDDATSTSEGAAAEAAETDASAASAASPASVEPAAPLTSVAAFTDAINAVIESRTAHGLILRVLRHVTYDVLRVMVPSDVVAYLRFRDTYSSDPVLEHYASYVFKYPEHCAVWNEELQSFLTTYHRQGRSSAYTARDLLVVILRSIVRCHSNQVQTLAMAQRTTGLPAAATNSSLMRIFEPSPHHQLPDAPPWVTVRKSGSVTFHSGLARDGKWYVLDPADAAAIASVQETMDALRVPGRTTSGKIKNTYAALRLSRSDFLKSHAGIARMQAGAYTSRYNTRKTLFGRVPNFHAILPGNTADNGTFKEVFPDESDVYSEFPDAARCVLISSAVGIPYHLISLWFCLAKEAPPHALRAALDCSADDFLNYIALFNEATGINPNFLQLVLGAAALRRGDGLSFDSSIRLGWRLEPSFAGDGYGRTARDILSSR